MEPNSENFPLYGSLLLSSLGWEVTTCSRIVY